MSEARPTVRVKICGITRPQDVAAAVEAGADALGFVFTPRSRRAVDANAASPLVREVPALVARVGLFMDQGFEDVARILDRVPLNLLQFHGDEDPDFCRQFGLPYVKALAMGSADDADGVERLAAAYDDAAALLLDAHAGGEAGGTGRTFDWGRIPRLQRPLILAGGLTPDNVREAVTRVRPWAVDVSSGVEDAPGLKNRAKIQKFIREAKSE